MAEKIVQVPGVGNVSFPDTMSDDEISSAIQQQQPKSLAPSLLASRQEISKQQYNAAQPPSTMLSRARDLTLGAVEGLGLNPSAPVTGTLKNLGSAMASIPQLPRAIVQNPMGVAKSLAQPFVEGPQEAYEGIKGGDYGQMAHGVGKTLAVDLPAIAGLGAAANAIPSATRAGKTLEQVMGAAKDIPINTSEIANVVDRAKQLKATGSSMPKVMGDMNRALQANQPIPYSAGRDFATSAGRMSVAESLGTNPVMKAQVGKLAAALKDANRGAAVTAGMGDLYDQAITEYRQAMGIKDAADVAKKWITRAAIGAGTYKLYRELSDK